MNEASKSQDRVIETDTQTPTRSEPDTATQSLHTNTSDFSVLLSRFAAVAQRLKGTGAPGVPDDIEIEIGYISGYNAESDQTEQLENHRLALAGCVLWAMGVAEYGRRVCPVIATCEIDEFALDMNPENACDMLESIADAIGGG